MANKINNLQRISTLGILQMLQPSVNCMRAHVREDETVHAEKKKHNRAMFPPATSAATTPPSLLCFSSVTGSRHKQGGLTYRQWSMAMIVPVRPTPALQCTTIGRSFTLEHHLCTVCSRPSTLSGNRLPEASRGTPATDGRNKGREATAVGKNGRRVGVTDEGMVVLLGATEHVLFCTHTQID